jgi:hypothetical protein
MVEDLCYLVLTSWTLVYWTFKAMEYLVIPLLLIVYALSVFGQVWARVHRKDSLD